MCHRDVVALGFCLVDQSLQLNGLGSERLIAYELRIASFDLICLWGNECVNTVVVEDLTIEVLCCCSIGGRRKAKPKVVKFVDVRATSACIDAFEPQSFVCVLSLVVRPLSVTCRLAIATAPLVWYHETLFVVFAMMTVSAIASGLDAVTVTGSATGRGVGTRALALAVGANVIKIDSAANEVSEYRVLRRFMVLSGDWGSVVTVGVDACRVVPPLSSAGVKPKRKFDEQSVGNCGRFVKAYGRKCRGPQLVRMRKDSVGGEWPEWSASTFYARLYFGAEFHWVFGFSELSLVP